MCALILPFVIYYLRRHKIYPVALYYQLHQIFYLQQDFSRRGD